MRRLSLFDKNFRRAELSKVCAGHSGEVSVLYTFTSLVTSQEALFRNVTSTNLEHQFAKYEPRRRMCVPRGATPCDVKRVFQGSSSLSQPTEREVERPKALQRVLNVLTPLCAFRSLQAITK